MDTYTSECYDSIALFLCIHIVHRYKVIMHKRNAPVLDKSVTFQHFFHYSCRGAINFLIV